MDTQLKVLVVEDSENDTILLVRKLKKGGFDPQWKRVDDAKSMLKEMTQNDWDLIISDYSMPNFNGLEALKLYKQMKSDIPFIIVSGMVGEDSAVMAMKEGAHDYLMKDNLERLIPAIKRELREAAIRRERKQSMHLLKEREEFLNAVIENIPHMIFIKDAQDLRFLRLNKSGERLLGYSREEMIGKCNSDFFPKEIADFFTKTDREALQHGDLVDIPQETVQTKDQGERILSTKKIPILDEKGIPKYLLGISDDITEKKHAEQIETDLRSQLRQAQKMESIGTLAGGIAHDFNNILTAILGYAEIASDSVVKGSKAQDYMKEVIKASMRATELVQQILTFSRQTESECIAFRMDTIVKEALGLLRPTLPSSIEIKEDINPGMIKADPTQIHQVVMNLCTNAYHAFGEDGGTLSVSLSTIEIDKELAAQHRHLPLGPAMKLTVSDTGCGMDDVVLERIFDPYFSTKEKGQGTGLGLSVVHGIVKSHDGAVTVSSTPGKGSCFNVYFPKVEQLKETTHYENMNLLKSGTEKILLVDDEPAIVELNKILLTKLGYNVATQTSSEKALELFSTDPYRFDLIITDMAMPKLTGYKLAEMALTIRSDIPIILCTGFSEHINAEKTKHIGIRAVLMKPFMLKTLSVRIREVLDGEGDVIGQ